MNCFFLSLSFFLSSSIFFCYHILFYSLSFSNFLSFFCFFFFYFRSLIITSLSLFFTFHPLSFFLSFFLVIFCAYFSDLYPLINIHFFTYTYSSLPSSSSPRPSPWSIVLLYILNSYNDLLTLSLNVLSAEWLISLSLHPPPPPWEFPFAISVFNKTTRNNSCYFIIFEPFTNKISLSYLSKCHSTFFPQNYHYNWYDPRDQIN